MMKFRHKEAVELDKWQDQDLSPGILALGSLPSCWRYCSRQLLGKQAAPSVTDPDAPYGPPQVLGTVCFCEQCS